MVAVLPPEQSTAVLPDEFVTTEIGGCFMCKSIHRRQHAQENF